VRSLFQDIAFPSRYFCRTHCTVRNTFAADCDSFRTLSHAGHQPTPSNSVLLLQFFSLNCFLACIIKISSENTEVCLVCTLLPLIHFILLFFLLWHYSPLWTCTTIIDFFQSAVFDQSFQIFILRLIVPVQSAHGCLYFIIFVLLLQHVHSFVFYPPAIRISKSKCNSILIAEFLLMIFVFLLLFRVPLVFKTIELLYKNISSCIVPYMFLYLNLNTVNFVLSVMKTKRSAQNALGSKTTCVFARQTPSSCAELNSCAPPILAS